MMATARFFNNSDFSDIIIKFSDREVKCHKIILCESEYFNKLCGPRSSFKESTASVIELLEDDSRALEAVLRHIYGDDSPAPGLCDDWKHQLEMAKTSYKYLFPKLEEMAMWRFKKSIDDLTDINTIADAIATIRANGDQEKHFDIANALETKHLHALLKNDSHRAHLEEYPEVMLSHLDRLSFDGDLVQVDMAVCKSCHSVALCKIGTAVTRNCDVSLQYQCRFEDYAKCMVPRYTAVQAGVDCDS